MWYFDSWTMEVHEWMEIFEELEKYVDLWKELIKLVEIHM